MLTVVVSSYSLPAISFPQPPKRLRFNDTRSGAVVASPLVDLCLQDRVTFMSLSCSRGRSMRTRHKEGSREPLRFYVQIKHMEDLTMLIIPPKFVEVMKEWLVVKLPPIVRLSANKWSELWVQVQNFEGQIP
ncbi:Protein TOC75, chloroplastic [Hordeum vulgare]|nr:Protein TOC75, chloroplastic [Hordeum vulgare]